MNHRFTQMNTDLINIFSEINFSFYYYFFAVF